MGVFPLTISFTGEIHVLEEKKQILNLLPETLGRVPWRSFDDISWRHRPCNFVHWSSSSTRCLCSASFFTHRKAQTNTSTQETYEGFMKRIIDRIGCGEEERFAFIFPAPSFVAQLRNYRRAMKCRPSEKLTKDTIYNKVSKIKMLRAEESSIKQLSPGNSHGPFDQQGFVHKMSTRLDFRNTFGDRSRRRFTWQTVNWSCGSDIATRCLSTFQFILHHDNA